MALVKASALFFRELDGEVGDVLLYCFTKVAPVFEAIDGLYDLLCEIP